jgi:hypothetical protein
MPDHNQEDSRPEDSIGERTAAPEPPPSTESLEPPSLIPPTEAPLLNRAPLGRSLVIWFVVLVTFGVGGVLLRMNELALLMAMTGMFVAAQAADLTPALTPLYYSISWVAPFSAAGGAIAIGLQIRLLGSISFATRLGLEALTALGGALALLSIFRPVSNAITRILFPRTEPSHTTRLAARITLLTLVLALPAWFAVQGVLSDFLDDPRPLFDRVSLGGELIGYIALAFASVGFMLRRRLGESLERLGIRPLQSEHWILVVIGVVALYALNSGADWIQKMLFPKLWASDHHVNERLTAGLSAGRAILLGLSAGIGEEITMRGALQPKLGIVLTALLFATLHVQYSWFGMLVIFMLGITLGLIRNRASTTAAMAVHTIYDVIAVFSV